MRRVNRVSVFVGVALLATAADAVSQDRTGIADPRGPQFLLASARTSEPPVVIDAVVVPALRRRIALDLRDVSRAEALAAIARASNLQLLYANGVVPEGRVRLRAEEITVAAALTDALLGTGIDVLITRAGYVVLVKRKVPADASGDVQGRVTNAATGQPLAAADVFLDKTKWHTTTDTAGRYRLADVDPGTYVLVVRMVGYTRQSRKVVVREAAEDTADVMLAPIATRLDSLITTATGKQRRRDLGNAITVIRADSVLEHAPIKSLTDLLEHRVPGLTVQHTTGAPGDPSKLRLRGLGSALRSNDPVVVVDGVRVYAAQSEVRSGNLTNLLPKFGDVPAPAPSPLDQIDPNTIEKIEVFKGPSAATLYGADAANGVIVVTTKRGKPGPTRWNARLTQGRSDVLGHYPTGYYRWGHKLGSTIWRPAFCSLLESNCIQDSLVRFQALNVPSLTVLGSPGRRTGLSLTASGGTQALTYSVTGSYSDELGNFQLPDFEVQRFQDAFHRPVPNWMQRSHRYATWGVQSNITARLSPVADLTLLTALSRSKQQRTSLEQQVPLLAATYIDTINGRYYRPDGYINFRRSDNILGSYYTHITASAITFTTGLNGSWRPRSWFTAIGQAGLDVRPRDDESLLPAQLVSAYDSGSITHATGRSVVGTVGVQGELRRGLGRGFLFITNVGANLQSTSTSDLASAASGLVPGTSSIAGARRFTATDQAASTSIYGWYVEPRVTSQRFSLSTGLRLDGGSAYGARVTGNGFNLLSLPKLNGSWTISEEPWFPFKQAVNSLRLRGAYGQAQTQPGAADRFRLYEGTTDPLGGGTLRSVGNTQLRPERSTELEGGFDADLLDRRLSIELTAYRKLNVDALMNMNLPASVNGGGAVMTNIGNIKNTGVELTLGLTPVRSTALTWATQLHYSSNQNELVKLGRGVLPKPEQGLVAGYPVGSRWERPILGFADLNGDGVLQRNEIQVGDSAVFVGRLYPKYQAWVSTDVTLFRNVQVSASFSYDAGQTQQNALALSNWVLNPALSDPSTPLSEQAKFIAASAAYSDGRSSLDPSVNNYLLSPSTQYGVMELVSTFRFSTLSINYRAPGRLAKLVGAQQLSVALQGSNLGLHSTYSGKDPNVNAWSPGESIVDTGQLPLPREWNLALFLEY